MIVKLTHDQKEVLHSIVIGAPMGIILRSLPPLIARGLLVQNTEPSIGPNPAYTKYMLTPVGLQAYMDFREKEHQVKLQELTQLYQRDIAWAACRTLKEEVGDDRG